MIEALTNGWLNFDFGFGIFRRSANGVDQRQYHPDSVDRPDRNQTPLTSGACRMDQSCPVGGSSIAPAPRPRRGRKSGSLFSYHQHPLATYFVTGSRWGVNKISADSSLGRILILPPILAGCGIGTLRLRGRGCELACRCRLKAAFRGQCADMRPTGLPRSPRPINAPAGPTWSGPAPGRKAAGWPHPRRASGSGCCPSPVRGCRRWRCRRGETRRWCWVCR